MQVRISGPEEGATMRGYVSVEVLEQGDLLAETNVSPEIVDDVLGDDPAEAYRALADAVEALEESDAGW